MINKINVIYQDDEILVLDKPPGLVVDSSETNKLDTLEETLRTDFNIKLDRGGIVHRLDKDTSGLIIVAKTQNALDNLQNQFKERETKKEYLALVHGFITESGRVEGGIGRNPGNREKFIVLEDGKEAATGYEPMERLELTDNKFQEIYSEFNKIQVKKMERQHYGDFTLVRCKPETGRTHQIRVHLKHISHPIVADEKYSGRKTFRLDKRWCSRQFLHAAKISFRHPVSNKWMSLESPLPEDLKKALESLKPV